MEYLNLFRFMKSLEKLYSTIRFYVVLEGVLFTEITNTERLLESMT